MRTLILVDLQVDFAPGGALPVPNGDETVNVANKLMSHFDLVVGTKDWHPPNHVSFAANHEGKKPGDIITVDGLEQVLWPIHCVENSKGAEYIPGLETEKIARTIHKGLDPEVDGYSGFFDNGYKKATPLNEYLTEKNVEDTWFLGLATDYCVRATVLDAIKLGYKVRVVTDGCRGIDQKPGDVERTLEEFKEKGAQLVTSDDVLQELKDN